MPSTTIRNSVVVTNSVNTLPRNGTSNHHAARTRQKAASIHPIRM